MVEKLIWIAYTAAWVYGSYRFIEKGDKAGMWCCLAMALGGILGWAGKVPLPPL